MRKSFIVHNDSLGVLDDLTDEQCGELFRAIRAYQLGESIDLSPIVKVAFSPFKNQFARDEIKYEKLCEKNRLIAVNRHKPKDTKSTTGNQSSPTVTKSTDNDSKSDSDSDSKNKSDSKNVRLTPDGSHALKDDWIPDKNLWEGKAFQSGLLNKDYQPYLTEFICHYQGQAAKPESYWIGKLISWIKRAPAAKETGAYQHIPLTNEEFEDINNG